MSYSIGVSVFSHISWNVGASLTQSPCSQHTSPFGRMWWAVGLCTSEIPVQAAATAPVYLSFPGPHYWFQCRGKGGLDLLDKAQACFWTGNGKLQGAADYKHALSGGGEGELWERVQGSSQALYLWFQPYSEVSVGYNFSVPEIAALGAGLSHNTSLFLCCSSVQGQGGNAPPFLPFSFPLSPPFTQDCAVLCPAFPCL